MSTTFTPGPWLTVHSDWSVDTDSSHAHIAVGPNDTDPVALVVGADFERCEELEGNATLIASAPELYEALRNLVRINDGHGPFGGELYQDRIDRAWDAARAALAKARGEA